MFEDIINTLDSLGVEYTEDYDNGTLEIDIADVDKDTLVSIIAALNSTGDTFDITESLITVQGTGESYEPEGDEGETDYMSEALDQYGAGGGMGF